MAEPAGITFSGGVSEYLFGYEEREFGDIAKMLAAELRAELNRRTALKLIDPGQRIRATVIGASQFTVQVSGKTIHLPQPGVLPVHNVPVVHVGRDVDLDAGDAIDGDAIAAAIGAGLARLDLDPRCACRGRVLLDGRSRLPRALPPPDAPSCGARAARNARRTAAARDRRRHRQDVGPHPRRGARALPAISSRSTACSSRSSISSMSAN